MKRMRRQSRQSRSIAISRPAIPSNAICATGCRSWDACIAVPPAPRYGLKPRNCARKFTPSAPSPIFARLTMGNRGVIGCLKGIRHPHPGPPPRLNVGEGIERKMVGEGHFLYPLPDLGEGDASNDESRIFIAKLTEGVCDAA